MAFDATNATRILVCQGSLYFVIRDSYKVFRVLCAMQLTIDVKLPFVDLMSFFFVLLQLPALPADQERHPVWKVSLVLL